MKIFEATRQIHANIHSLEKSGKPRHREAVISRLELPRLALGESSIMLLYVLYSINSINFKGNTLSAVPCQEFRLPLRHFEHKGLPRFLERGKASGQGPRDLCAKKRKHI